MKASLIFLSRDLEYLVVVRDSLATYDEKCNDAVSSAITQMQKLVETTAGRSQLKDKFRFVQMHFSTTRLICVVLVYAIKLPLKMMSITSSRPSLEISKVLFNTIKIIAHSK